MKLKPITCFMAILFFITVVFPLSSWNKEAFAATSNNNNKHMEEIKEELEREDYASVIVYFQGEGERLMPFNQKGRDFLPERVEALKGRVQENHQRTSPLLDNLEKGGNLKDYKSFWIINGFHARVDEYALDRLYRSPRVEKIILEPEIYLLGKETYLSPRDKDLEEMKKEVIPFHLHWLDVPRVWDLFSIDGSGVTVAILDTGVDYNHPALKKRYRGDHQYSWYDVIDEDNSHPVDPHGHGTHVMGTLVGGSPGETIGVSPGAQWMAVRVLNEFGYGKGRHLLEGMEWLLNPGGDPEKAPHIISLSMGTSDSYDHLFWDIVKELREAGIFLSCAAGNIGPSEKTIASPASYPHSFAIGALEGYEIASFSSRGPVTWDSNKYYKPDIVTQGVGIYSSVPDGAYAFFSGTSMAAPQVAGVAALMLEADPSLTPQEIEKILLDTSYWREEWGVRPNHTYGQGDAWAFPAVASLLVKAPSFSVPREGEIFYEKEIEVEGKAYPESTVKIYREKTLLKETRADKEGIFSGMVELDPGLNSLYAGVEFHGYLSEISPGLEVTYYDKEKVEFEDPNLEEEIRKALEIQGEITPQALSQLEGLELPFREIESLKGLEHARNLKELDLSGNPLGDLSQLTHMKNLKSLKLGGNLLEDITFLENLTNLEVLCLSHNLIQDLSPLVNLIHLEELRLNSNRIKDLTPLLEVVQRGMGEKALIDLRYNNLSLEEASESVAHIEALQGLIQEVKYMPQRSLEKEYIILEEIGGVARDKGWNIRFNLSLNPQSIHWQNIYIKEEDTNQKIEVEVTLKEGTIVEIKPRENYQGETRYNLYVGENVQAERGGYIKNPVKMPFKTR